MRYGVVAGALRVFMPAADVASGSYCIALCGKESTTRVGTAASAPHMKTKKIQRFMFETAKKKT